MTRTLSSSPHSKPTAESSTPTRPPSRSPGDVGPTLPQCSRASPLTPFEAHSTREWPAPAEHAHVAVRRRTAHLTFADHHTPVSA
eukprot:3136716-Prymnesium_polylepis.1